MTLQEYFEQPSAMSRGELAALCGVTRSMLGHIVAGRRNPSGSVAAKIVAYTDGAVSLQELFPQEFAMASNPPQEERVNG